MSFIQETLFPEIIKPIKIESNEEKQTKSSKKLKTKGGKMYKCEQPRLDFGVCSELFKVIKKLSPENEPLLKIKPFFDKFIERVESKIIIKFYSVGTGRPAYSIKMLIGMMIIQLVYDIKSDRKVYRLCLTDALCRYFIGCNSFDDPIPDDTTLVKFRKRLGEEGFREIFNEIVKMAKEAGKIDKTRIIDSTYINAMGKKFSFVKFIREGINRTIKLIKDGEIVQRLRAKYQFIKIKTKRTAKKIAKNFIEEIGKLKELPQKVKGIISTMKLAISGEPVVNFTDADARWGHKSDSFLFSGYKLEALITKNGFVTAFRVLPGNVNEGQDISPLIEEEEKLGVKCEELIGDGLYPSAKNLKYLLKKGIKGYFPKRTKTSNIDKFNWSNDKVICSKGKEAIGSIPQQNGLLFYWSAKDCGICSLKRRCISPGECRNKVYLSNLKAMKIEERRDKLKLRNVIERTFAHGKIHGMRDSRYKGKGKTTIHSSMVCVLLNLECLASP